MSRRRGGWIVAVAIIAAGCQSRSVPAGHTTGRTHPSLAAGPNTPPPPQQPADGAPTIDVYANDRPGNLSPVVHGMPTLLYVPNSEDSTLDEIDPATGRVVRHFGVGKSPQHVVPSWDLRTLYVTSDTGNSLTPIDPTTGEPRRRSPSKTPTTSTSRPTAGPRWS